MHERFCWDTLYLSPITILPMIWRWLVSQYIYFSICHLTMCSAYTNHTIHRYTKRVTISIYVSRLRRRSTETRYALRCHALLFPQSYNGYLNLPLRVKVHWQPYPQHAGAVCVSGAEIHVAGLSNFGYNTGRFGGGKRAGNWIGFGVPAV